MTILFLTSRFPYPPYRGDKLKIFNLMKRLAARGHRLVLCSFVASEEEAALAEQLRGICADVRTIVMPPLHSVMECAKALASRDPFQVAYFRSRKMELLIARTMRDYSFDMVHVHLIRMAQYGMGIRNVPRILDLTDAGSLYLKRFLAVTKSPVKRIFLPEELRRLSRYEQILEHFDESLVCSEVDREVLRGHAPAASIGLLYNGIDIDYFTDPGTYTRNAGRIIYTGNMSYYPNADGILYFAKEIFPLVQEKIPQASLVVVGQNPPARVKSLHGGAITVTGFVEDIRAEYLQSSVSIAPIRFGSGTLNKILEPMALGMPIVATSQAAEGLPLTDGDNILIADDPTDFAHAVARVLDNAALRDAISRRAAATVREQYSWEHVVDDLEQIYMTVMARFCQGGRTGTTVEC